MKRRFQIRDDDFGLAMYVAESPSEALLDYFADRERGKMRHAVTTDEDGETAKVTVGDRTFRAVPL